MTREAKKLSWQLFGKNFSGSNITVEDAIKEAGLDYNVSSQPLIRVTPEIIDLIKNGEKVEISPNVNDIINSHKVTVRDDNDMTLGVVGKNYGIVQNSKAFEFIDFLKEVSGSSPTIETAGALGYGERIFVTCRLGADSYLDGNKDAVRNYVVFSNSHDGSGSVMAFFTPVRIICQNTLNVAIAQCKNKVTFKHTSKVNTRLDWEIEENRRKALEIFRRSVTFSDKFINNMISLKSEKLSDTQITDITNRVFLTDAEFALFKKNNRNIDTVDEISMRKKNAIRQLSDSIVSGVGQEMYRGTKLWMLNGITTMLQNDKQWKNEQDKYNSLMEGDAQRKVQKMYDLILAA